MKTGLKLDEVFVLPRALEKLLHGRCGWVAGIAKAGRRRVTRGGGLRPSLRAGLAC
jgi:hypothetical protein